MASQDIELSYYLRHIYFNQYNSIISTGLLVLAIQLGIVGIFWPLWLAGELVWGYKCISSDDFRAKVKEAFALENFEAQENELFSLLSDGAARESYRGVKRIYTKIQETMQLHGGSDSLIAWNDEIEKLKTVQISYLRLANNKHRLQQLAYSFNVTEVKEKIEDNKRKLETDSPALRSDREKIIMTLARRLRKAETAEKLMEKIDLQLELIEEQFQLVQEQVALAKSPQEYNSQLDVLVDGINNLEQSELGLLESSDFLADKFDLLLPEQLD